MNRRAATLCSQGKEQNDCRHRNVDPILNSTVLYCPAFLLCAMRQGVLSKRLIPIVQPSWDFFGASHQEALRKGLPTVWRHLLERLTAYANTRIEWDITA